MRKLSSVVCSALILASSTVSATAAQAPQKVPGAGGVNIAVYEFGNPDGPPIVLIHGFLATHLTWSRQFSGALADSFRLIAYDLRGHGASDKPLDPASYSSSEAWAGDLAAVIKFKGLVRPVLVGWSYGGLVLADYLRINGSESVGGLVFLAASTRAGTPEASAMINPKIRQLFPGLLSEDVLQSVTATRSFLPLLAAEPLDADAREITLAGAMMVPPPVRQGMWARQLYNDDVLSAITVPTLVIHGRADSVLSPAAAEHIAATVPGAKLLLYDRVGHAVALEVPERFNRDLIEFMRHLPARD